MRPRICVFCGSKPGIDPAFRSAAQATGLAIARQGADLVYGGAAHGLMGAVADGALEGGAEVIGVMPSGLMRAEFAHPRLSAHHVVDSMHQRKALMHDLSNAFIALPGGLGTLDELFETLTWFQLGLHHKAIGLLDTNGFFQPLLTWFGGALSEGFVPRTHERIFVVDSSPERLVSRVLHVVPPQLSRVWVEK